MSQIRYDNNESRLDKMAGWAADRQKFIPEHSKKWDKDWYIRIGGEGFRAVSLNDKSPLFGFAEKATENLDEILCQFKYGKRELIKANDSSRQERRVQCWLIKNSNSDHSNLGRLLNLGNIYFDELFFALDEVRLETPTASKPKASIKCDILAVRVIGNDAYPVVIELKSRHDTKVMQQVKDYQQEMEKYQAKFATLLGNCISKKVSFSNLRKVIIWNRLPSGRVSEKTFNDCVQKEVGIIQYIWNHKSEPIENIKFEPYPDMQILQ
jgi:hypothetical protein